MKFLAVLAGLLAAVAVVGGLAFATGGGGSAPAPSTVDVSGPCDEAEHANDPRCTGVTGAAAGDDAREPGEDISGPCDEAEHASDPRCTGGAVAADDDDRSGPSGSSGPGRSGGDDDSSGHSDDDSSGHGSGGSDDD